MVATRWLGESTSIVVLLGTAMGCMSETVDEGDKATLGNAMLNIVATDREIPFAHAVRSGRFSVTSAGYDAFNVTGDRLYFTPSRGFSVAVSKEPWFSTIALTLWTWDANANAGQGAWRHVVASGIEGSGAYFRSVTVRADGSWSALGVTANNDTRRLPTDVSPIAINRTVSVFPVAISDLGSLVETYNYELTVALE